MNKKYLVAAVGAALAVAGGAAHAIDAKLSGQVSRGVMYADDGVTKETHHVDAADATRFRFTGDKEILPGVKAGIVFEVEYVSNPSSTVNNHAVGGRSISPTLDERIMQVYFDGSFGRLNIGQAQGAADGLTENDLSGTGIIGSMTVSDYGGRMQFRNSATQAASGIQAREAVNNLDFESRYDRVRYDSPALGPVKLSVSSGVKTNGAGLGREGATSFLQGGTQGSDKNVNEVAVRFGQDMGAAGKIEAGVGFSKKDATFAAGGDIETTGGSVAYASPIGVNIALAYATVENVRFFDAKYMGVKLGFKTGRHAVSAQLNKAEDLNDTMDAAGVVTRTGDEGTLKALGYVYQPVGWAELFAGYHIWSLDRPAVGLEDIKLVTVGSRLKF
jgi:hypothetical protein